MCGRGLRTVGSGIASYLLCVFSHVGVDLAEGAHGVELAHVHPGLLGQVGVHVLVADCRHFSDV